MLAHLPAVVAQLPDVVTVPEIVRRVNAANGIGLKQWPKITNTHQWQDIYEAITEFGYLPTYIASYTRDDQGHKIPTLVSGFARSTKKD